MATSFDSFVSNAINPAQTIHDNMEPWTIDIWLTEYTIPNPITLIVLLLMIFLVYLIAAAAMTMVLFLKFGLFVTIARSEEHTSELQSLMRSSYAVFCLHHNKKQKTLHI